jgi:hypothetical protein
MERKWGVLRDAAVITDERQLRHTGLIAFLTLRPTGARDEMEVGAAG